MADLFENRRLIRDHTLTARYQSQFDSDRLHVRAVHNTWGIADGLEVKLSPDGTLVEISPGVGYDSDGAPIKLTTDVTVAPSGIGEYDIVATEDDVTAVSLPRDGWCPGSLAVASARAFARSSQSLAWTDLRLPTRWTRRRESAYVFAGSQTFFTFERRLTVSTGRARFPSTPLYFCRLDGPSPDVATPYTPLGVRGVPARNRYPGGAAAPIHGPFFTICSAMPDSFNVLFTRAVTFEYSTLTVHWVGVVPRSQILDGGEPCQTYPTPPTPIPIIP
jgi:hypothetical protein